MIEQSEEHSDVIELYRKNYADLQFERAGLFELMQQIYRVSQALYPGCFVHLTPSLYFPHVVYVDRHPETQAFFADLESVSQFVERNKHYKRSAYIRFIAQDFTEPLPLPEASFDLLISLFAGGIARTCKRYLKPGGLLITNNHHKDVQDSATDAEFELLSAIRFQRGKYRLIEDHPARLLASHGGSARVLRYLRQGDRGIEYVENESYYVFRRRP